MADAEKLRKIQAALQRDFGNEPAVAPCQNPRHVHLLYAHTTHAASTPALLPLSAPEFDQRVDAWVWPSVQAYEDCKVIKHTRPYRDFITARFLWRELPGVSLGPLPPNVTQPAPTTADGGTLLQLSEGTGPSLQHGKPLTVRVTFPAEQAVSGYPTIRRVCFSTVNTAGQHAEINTPEAPGEVTANLTYPAPTVDTELHLLSAAPWFRFELRDHKGNAFQQIADPWADSTHFRDTWPHKIKPGNTFLYEKTTNTQIGDFSRYTFKNKRGETITFYGIKNVGEDLLAAVRSNYQANMSPSRRRVIEGVLGVEGKPGAIQTYDGPKLSWGMNQWNRGELAQLLAYIYDFFPVAFAQCFGRYGIGVYFEGRNRNWGPAPPADGSAPRGALGGSAYRNPILFRIPCCVSSAHLQRAWEALTQTTGETALNLHRTLAETFRMTDAQSTSYAMAYIFHKAGTNEDIQRAQVQWTSFRLSNAIRNAYGQPLPAGNEQPPRRLSNDDALDYFLRSLGSNEDQTTRLNNANTTVGSRPASEGIPVRTANFQDEATTAEWKDWETRCRNANKEVLVPGQSSQSRSQRPQRKQPSQGTPPRRNSHAPRAVGAGR